jgi:hypothetical protein
MFEVLLIMALTVIATVSMVVGIGELIDSRNSNMKSSTDMNEQTGMNMGMDEMDSKLESMKMEMDNDNSMQMDMNQEKEMSTQKPDSTISEIDLVYNDRMSRIEGSKIKGIKRDGNNLILEMAEEEDHNKMDMNMEQDDMLNMIKGNDIPKNDMSMNQEKEMPPMESHVEKAEDLDEMEMEKKDSLMDKIKKMTGI